VFAVIKQLLTGVLIEQLMNSFSETFFDTRIDSGFHAVIHGYIFDIVSTVQCEEQTLAAHGLLINKSNIVNYN